MKIPSLQKRYGHRGVALLRIAVLEVLYLAKKNGKCMGGAEIGRRAGIFREPGWAIKQGNDLIVWGILNSLVKDGYLEKCTQQEGKQKGKPGWALTEQMFSQRDREVNEIPSWGGDKRIIEIYRIKQWGFCPGCLSVLPNRPDIDHILPKSKGGDDTPENKQLLCPNCNRRRGNKSYNDFLADKMKDGTKFTDYTPDDEIGD